MFDAHIIKTLVVLYVDYNDVKRFLLFNANRFIASANLQHIFEKADKSFYAVFSLPKALRIHIGKHHLLSQVINSSSESTMRIMP